MSYNQKQKLIDNIEALKVIKTRGEHYSPWTDEEEIEILEKWSGVGGLKGVLLNWDASVQQWMQDGASKKDVELYELYQQFFELVREVFPFSERKKVESSVKNGILTQFFTPNVVCSTFYEVLKEYTQPTKIYECSAGSGVFIKEAIKAFPDLEVVTAYEKDIVTAKILENLLSDSYFSTVHNKGFEESDDNENGKYDLLVSNVPFGDIPVYDKEFSKNKLTNDFCKRIHNYFVAKSIQKVRDGGVIAMLITDAFLNTVSNKSIRRYLFERCDFISLTVMPDNLMDDSAGTMAPSHFLVVRKREGKTELSTEEELLCHSEFQDIDGAKIAMNQYIYSKTLECIRIGETKLGKNQYGKAAIEVYWNAPIEEIAKPFKEILERDFARRWVSLYDAPAHIKQYPLTVDQAFSKAAEIAIEESGLSDLFKYPSEHVEERGEGIYKQMQKPVVEEKDIKLPEFVPFKDGLLVQK